MIDSELIKEENGVLHVPVHKMNREVVDLGVRP